MSNRRFIVLFLVGIVLLVAALRYLSCRARSVASSTTRNTLCTFAPETVDGLEIARNGTNVVCLARDEKGAWGLVAPYAAPADASAVARLVDAVTMFPLADMRTEDELAGLREDLADFGLSGAGRVSVAVQAGAARAVVRFGAVTASGREVYARTDGLRNVFTLSVAALEAVPEDADGFRRRALVLCPREEVVGVDLRAPEAPFVRLVRAGGGWKLATPVEAPADGAAVESLLNGLVTARIGGFVLPSAAHPPPVAAEEGTALPSAALAPYGLASDAGLAVTLRLESGAFEQVVFGAAAGTNLVYALVQGGTAVVALEAAVADLCRAGGASFRDTRVFPVGADERVESVSVTEGNLVYVLAKDTNGVWRLEAPVVAPADQVAAAALADRVLRIRSSDVSGASSSDGAVRVSVATTAGVRPGVVVPRGLFADCGALADLRSKTLFTIDPAAVARITMKSVDGGTVAVVRDPSRGTWAFDAEAGARPATVKVDAVKALLAALARVEAAGVETVAASPSDSRRCGLDAPAFTLAVDFADAATVRRTILLGSAAPGGGRYATVGGADAVFILSRATAAALTVPITEQ